MWIPKRCLKICRKVKNAKIYIEASSLKLLISIARENQKKFKKIDLNAKTRQKFTPTPTTTTPEKQYICLASSSQARQKQSFLSQKLKSSVSVHGLGYLKTFKVKDRMKYKHNITNFSAIDTRICI